jgi:hypothetical protein
MGTHAEGHSFLICLGALINNLTNCLMSNQSFKNVLLILKSVRVHPSLICNQIGYTLCMPPRNYRVVNLVLVVVQSGVLKIELDKFDTVSKCVQWNLLAFYNGNKIIVTSLATMCLVNCYWLQITLKNIVIFKLAYTNTTCLSIEEVGRIKDGLSFVACHLREEVGILWLADHSQG